MGIQGLTKLISDNCPTAIKEDEIKNFFGRKIAVDASMSLYQFLIAVRPDQNSISGLTDETGETTSHLQGLFQRTIRMVNNGIKPIFVFDGKPPILKTGELAKRKKRKEEAEEAQKEAKESENAEAEVRFAKRTVRVTPKHNEEARKLLRLMGIPVIEAPGEAEAQCSALASSGLVYATGSEDMDSLTFGTSILVRHLTFSEQRKLPIKEIHLNRVLDELKFTMDQFIDLCILLGCDYCESIRGIGPVRALDLMKKHGSLEEIVKHLDKEKYSIPESFDFDSVRNLFKSPDVTDPSKLVDKIKWNDPDEEGLIQFLVKEKGFNEDRVKNGCIKLKKARGSSIQGRLTSFFGEPTIKRKREETQEPKKKKLKGQKDLQQKKVL
jgi:flap endonuclease-1